MLTPHGRSNITQRIIEINNFLLSTVYLSVSVISDRLKINIKKSICPKRLIAFSFSVLALNARKSRKRRKQRCSSSLGSEEEFTGESPL